MTGGVVLVLGETGRNFAAGMSGGLAFVYDVKKTFSKRCHQERCALVTPEPEDLILMKQMIGDHTEFTGSNVGRLVEISKLLIQASDR